MKKYFVLLGMILLFFGCSHKEPKPSVETVQKVTFVDLPKSFSDENFTAVLEMFDQNCRAEKTLKLYPNLCEKAQTAKDPKKFIVENFEPYQLNNEKDNSQEGLLTGYYLASINASLTKTGQYQYPVYETPADLVSVNLSAIYPELKHYRLRGRLVNGKIVPYYTREEASELEAPILCYCDSKIDKFFLEIQGSGKVYLDDNSTKYIGYDNQNGHKYKAIGRYLVQHGEINIEDVSMQSIRTWLQQHPDRIDEVLNYNDSMVFFKFRDKGAVGALGLELTPMRSVAVDRKYIKLGAMLYLDADLQGKKMSQIVFAQDTRGAIRGSVRADLFTGFGDQAELLAGSLKAPLKLWIFLPKKDKEEEHE
ncbi:MAG: murein transglycosylase A [Campylobacterales bacterium]|nr:murein transglycosylase A [Campylobacterales bacterium]